MTAAFWCEQAWLGPAGVGDGVVITVEGDSIGSVEHGVASPPEGATRLDGVTMPGFANAHSHAFHRALRGRTHGDGGTFWTWRDQMYRLAATLDPERYLDLATATFTEMVMAGYTAVGEFHYLHHAPGGARYPQSPWMGQSLIHAADRAGLRITLLDTCYLAGGIGTELNDVQRRFSDGTVEAWADRVMALQTWASELTEGDGVENIYRIGAAVHSVRALEPDAIERVAKWAAETNAVLHAHVSEQPAENEECLEAYGCTPVELLSRCGALSERFTAVHATHLTTRDIELLASSGSRVCICATTERELADGIGPTAALRAAGVQLCIGSDSHAVIDPFEETRAIELDERLASLRRGTHTVPDLLAAASESGYASLGWRGGVLAPGYLADFVTVGFDSPRLAGSDRSDPAAAAVFAAASSDVRDVVVGGRRVVRDGVHSSIDVVDSLDSSIRAAWQAVAP